MKAAADVGAAPVATRAAVFVGPARFQRAGHVANHPLFSLPRVALTFDLIAAYHAITESEYRVGRPATPDELRGFHTDDYIEALKRADRRGHVSHADRERHHLGNLENPWFPRLFETAAFATGSSIAGADEVLAGRAAFCPAGGMHHGLPDRARGFCYFNDPVLAIQRLKRAGKRVLYLDLDAHHGDGVELAFYDDPDVFTFSIHMDTRYAYPFLGGGVDDRGGARGEGACLNAPLPRAVNDSEYALVFDTLWPAAMRAFRPDVVVLQAGTDVLAADPLGKLCVSTALFLRLVRDVVAQSPALLVLGGGGYHPLLLARCWTGVWAALSGRELPARMPPEGAAVLKGVEWDLDDDEAHYPALFDSHLDAPTTGPIRPEIEALVAALLRHPGIAA